MAPLKSSEFHPPARIYIQVVQGSDPTKLPWKQKRKGYEPLHVERGTPTLSVQTWHRL